MVESNQDEESRIIKRRIGELVNFKYPPPEPQWRGKLKDRCVMPAPSWTGVPYWDVVDLIEFEGQGKKFEAIRFGYYRK